MNSINKEQLLNLFIEKYGEDELIRYLNNRLYTAENVLTLICNSSHHKIPQEYLHGEVYVVTEGNLNLETEESILHEYKVALVALTAKLQEKSWKKIYLVPTGHTTLSMQIKLLVYNVLRISTIDLFYSKGAYFELSINYRELIK